MPALRGTLPWTSGRAAPTLRRAATTMRRIATTLSRLLLAYEPFYVLPIILLLLLALDGTLLDAWNLNHHAWLPWLTAFDLARHPWQIALLIVIPLLPWAARAWLTRRFAAAPGPDLALLLFLAGAQFGYTQSVTLDGSRARLLGIIGAVYLYYLVVNTTPHTRALRRWLYGLTGAAVAGALLTLSLLGFQLDESASAALLEPLFNVLRPLSLGPTFHLAFFEISQRTVANPNGLADFALVAALCAGATALLGRGRWARIIWAAAAAAAAALLLASGARTAVLGAAAGSALLLLASRRRRLAAAFAIALPLGLLLLLLVAIPASKTDDLLDLQNSAALRARLQVWSSYWGLIREHPITGAGLGLRSVAESYAARYGLGLYFTDPHAHNVLLQTYLEQTVFGVTGLGFLLFAAGRATATLPRLLRVRGSVRDAATIALTAAAIGCALIVHNLFDINLNTNLTAALFAGSIAILLRGTQLAGVTRPSFTISFPTAAWTLAAVLLLVTLAGLLPPPLSPHLYIR